MTGARVIKGKKLVELLTATWAGALYGREG
jgi:hypothetical protein